MNKKRVSVSIIILILVFLGIYFFIKYTDNENNSEEKNIIDKIVEVFSSDNEEENTADDSGNVGGASGGGQGNQGVSDSPTESTDPPYEGLFCGVTGQIQYEGELNLTTDLDNAHIVIFNCMTSVMPSCSRAQAILQSNIDVTTLTYEIEGMSDGACVISSHVSSENKIRCNFSSEAISALFSNAATKYPNNDAAKSYEVFSFAQSGGGQVALSSGENESVICS